MARNYAAEYAARQARARQSGFGSYWQQRTARQLGIARPVPGRPDRFADPGARQLATRLSASDMRAGVNALKRKDFAEADRLARKAGAGRLRRRPRGVSQADWDNRAAPRRIFYYH